MIKAQDEAIAKRKKFTLAVSGGSLANQLVAGLSGRDGVQWDKWCATTLFQSWPFGGN